MFDALTDPKVLTAILFAFGSAITWLWTKIGQAQKNHRACEIEQAHLKEHVLQCDRDIAALQATCGILTQLLRKDIEHG